ncbi:hypothetical protein VPHPG9A1_0003 [Vibrio phage PG9A-1]
MGSKGSGGQSDTQKKTELMNQKSLLLQQKQAAGQDKRLAQERFKTEVSEWEASQMNVARRAAGAARRGGGSVFEKVGEDGRPTEGGYDEFDSIMADVDKQLSDLDKQIQDLDKPPTKPPANNKPNIPSSDNR